MKIFVSERSRNDLLRPRLSMKMMDYDLGVQDVLVQIDDPSEKKNHANELFRVVKALLILKMFRDNVLQYYFFYPGFHNHEKFF